ncbi:hypothetical protein HPB51_012459 [Rhipicephalus microplus]|uniref:Peptidase M13 N-terminal domain-containing protein n=1 Tax=Rhipicephalus microplus TaxID=6941 RepID=A0A9J6E9K4_RHIMP|nr:hypothetical protein HPB51_012459 [Rhipicephalus microplus]
MMIHYEHHLKNGGALTLHFCHPVWKPASQSEIRLFTGDESPVPKVDSLQILGMCIESNGTNEATLRQITAKAESALGLIRRISNRHRGIKKDNLIRIIHPSVLCDFSNSVAMHNWHVAERSVHHSLIRKVFKHALGLPVNTRTENPFNLDVHNTLEEIIEVQEHSQLLRLSGTKSGRKILDDFGLNFIHQCPDSMRIPRDIRSQLHIIPISCNMHPAHNVSRRRAKSRALLEHVRSNPTDARFVDAAPYVLQEAFPVVIVDSNSRLTCSTTPTASLSLVSPFIPARGEMASDPPEMIEATEPKPVLDDSGIEKPKRGRRGSDKDVSTQKDGEPMDDVPVPQTASADAMDTLKLRLIAAAVIVLIGCLFIVLTFLGVFKRSGRAISLPCVGEECHEVVLKADWLMDRHIKPCRDFYRHVCHHWIDKPANKPPTSFMMDMAHNYTKIWHRKLTEDHIRGDYAPLKQDASQFYHSCLVFYEAPLDVDAVTGELFHALQLPLNKWLKEKRPENFFHDIIRLSVVNRFHSLVSTTPIVTDSDKTLLIRRESPFHLLVNPIHERHLGQYARGVLKAIGKKQASDAIIDEVLKLDLKRARMVVEDGRTERSIEDSDCQRFPTSMWRRALRKALSAKEQEVHVEIEAPDIICEDLNAVLVRTTTLARPLYILALLAVPVLTYDYELSGERDWVAVKGACYRATGVAFEDVWLQLLSSFLAVSNSVEKAVDAFMDLIKLRMRDHLRDRNWMSEQDRSATLGRLAKVRLTRFRGAGLTVRAVMCYSDKFSVTANFTSNMVALRSRDVQKCLFYPEFSGSDARVVQILAGTDVVADPGTLTVYLPVSFTIPPMYHRRVDSDKFVNTALMGVQLARKVAIAPDFLLQLEA